MSLILPILTNGWEEFRHYYRITINPLISFTYLANNTFQINIFNENTSTNEYPRYHRLTTSITRDIHFNVSVPDMSPITPYIIYKAQY